MLSKVIQKKHISMKKKQQTNQMVKEKKTKQQNRPI